MLLLQFSSIQEKLTGIKSLPWSIFVFILCGLLTFSGLQLFDEKPVYADTCRVAIDPGHGGSDPGAVRQGIREKDIVFDISQRTAEILLGKGYFVTLTREDGSNPSDQSRVNVARNFNAHILVEIHTNANDEKKYPVGDGTEAWYQPASLNPRHADASRRLGELLAHSVAEKTGLRNRGVKRGESLYSSAMPVALIELAFINNATEREILINQPHLFASAVAGAIVDFLGSDCGSSPSTSTSNSSTHSGTVIGLTGGQNLNVRPGPSSGRDVPVLGTLPLNTRVEILARNSNATWYQIAFSSGPDGFGWVYARYIRTSASNLPVSDRVSSVPANNSPASSVAPAAPSQQPQIAGNMNMGRYCHAKGFDEAALAEHTAYGWYCSSGNGNRSGMDLEELCRQQHGSGYRPEHTNFSDPYSWRCVATNSAPAPAQPQPAQPAPPPQAPPRRTATHYQVSSQEWRCGDSGIIAIGLTPDGERRLRVSLIKCPTTQHAGKFGSSGHYFVRVDGVRVWRFNYSRDHSMFVEYIDPIERGYSGFHSYQIELYPDGQQEPILSGAISAHDVQVEE